ncbi:hypothetical protein ACFPU1_04730 [Thalassorhabdus alkalitolerans]|uniref:Ferredoxin n=1 Tax=Thalassorhabdus alkalitolerans TaxID=2282697 RepID=A0ABW0YIC5_9BACI|nr:hypothetical protein [Thalassobacillus sp. C254]
MSYIILTNKADYQTDVQNEGLEIVETYEYYFFKQLKATYSIAKVIKDDIKVTLREEKDGKTYTNHIPLKFFEAYEKIEDAHEELGEIAGPDSESARLVKNTTNEITIPS